ncbi:MAG: ATP-binding protein [Rhizomicrobium sp.]
MELEARLRESEETLDAIRSGEVDAVVVEGDSGRHIYTLTNADRPYRELIENMAEGAVTLSHQGITVYCNASFAGLMDEPSERVVGTPFARFVRPEELPLFDLLMNSDVATATELILMSSRGVRIPVLLSMSVLPDNPAGRIVCAIITDLRERHQIKALERGHAELEQLVEARTASLLRLVEERRRDEVALRQTEKLQVIGQLTGGIAHDFNNLLQVISGGVMLMKSPRTSDERKAVVLDAMEQAIGNGTDMVNRLLAFGRKQTLKPQLFQPNEQLQNLTELLSSTLGTQIALKTDLAPDLAPVQADLNQFEIAILNLAVNARDAMPSGGALTLRTRNEHRDGSDQVCITVADTGTGMPAAVHARIFEPFFTTKEVGKGTGLGLSQVHGFARQSGGDVVVDSAPGHGTSVTLCLPKAPTGVVSLAVAAAGAASAPKTEDHGSIAARAGKVALVVDDNREVADFSAALLEGLGYNVLKAGSAPDALAQLDSGKQIDVVFSDVVMPGAVGGVDLAKIVLARHPQIALVMATGYSENIELLNQLQVDVLMKPFRLEELSDALERASRKIS